MLDTRNDKLYWVTSLNVFANTFIEAVERFEWMAEATWGKVLAHNDAAISSVIDSIAGFQHGTE